MSSRAVRHLPASAVVIACLLMPWLAHGAEVKELLEVADRYRLANESMLVHTKVELFRHGQLQRERLYTVYTRPGRRSLVLFRSPSEKGQKVLMLEDEFWVILPTSQRPIRITPLQKLIGDAATGDIATMTWSEDYDGVVAREEEVAGVACVVLDLEARRKGVTYRRIVLTLRKDDSRPIQADLYVASDKLAKQAQFRLERRSGAWVVAAMVLKDLIQTGRETVISYESRELKTLPAEYYNPMFLVRNDVAE